MKKYLDQYSSALKGASIKIKIQDSSILLRKLLWCEEDKEEEVYYYLTFAIAIKKIHIFLYSINVLLSTQKTDILNTAKLMGVTVSVPVKTLAVEADGSVTDVTNYTRCRSTEEDVLKVSHYNKCVACKCLPFLSALYVIIHFPVF